MPALIPTDHVARITWLGRVPDRAAGPASVPAGEVMAGYAGIEGEAHSGLTRAVCVRVPSPSRSRRSDTKPLLAIPPAKMSQSVLTPRRGTDIARGEGTRQAAPEGEV